MGPDTQGHGRAEICREANHRIATMVGMGHVSAALSPRARKQARKHLAPLLNCPCHIRVAAWSDIHNTPSSYLPNRSLAPQAACYAIWSQKWQATQWSGSTSLNSGSFTEHTSLAYRHLGWNRQPLGGFTGLGTSPVRITRCRLPSTSGSGTGTALISAFVYG